MPSCQSISSPEEIPSCPTNSRAQISFSVLDSSLELFSSTLSRTILKRPCLSSMMPSPFSSTFASAAASTNGDSAGNRRENATNEWYGHLNSKHSTRTKQAWSGSRMLRDDPILGPTLPLTQNVQQQISSCVLILLFVGREIASMVPPKPSVDPL